MSQSETFGWAYASPTEPEKKCRWCEAENVEMGGLVVCVACDLTGSWPNNQPQEQT